ncbi:hypothetical protein BSKO_09557 [Bryopsis sp. KO-2023]|nr:hypothetical protein BSKO_09557 [Bryopsis sp. KO-2023]
MSKPLIVLTVIAVLTLPQCSATRHLREEDEPDLPPYEPIQRRYTNEIELRRYFGGVFVEIQSPPDTFPFTCEYSNWNLRDYFEGRNFAGKKVNYSGPLVVTLNTWDELKPRIGAYYVTDATEKRRFPSPMYPNYFQLYEPEYYYVKRIRHTMDIRTIMHEAFRMMADLVIHREAFSKEEVKVAMFNYPKRPEFPQMDEIWIKKVIRPRWGAFQENSAEELRIIGDMWLSQEPPPNISFDVV